MGKRQGPHVCLPVCLHQGLLREDERKNSQKNSCFRRQEVDIFEAFTLKLGLGIMGVLSICIRFVFFLLPG